MDADFKVEINYPSGCVSSPRNPPSCLPLCNASPVCLSRLSALLAAQTELHSKPVLCYLMTTDTLRLHLRSDSN